MQGHDLGQLLLLKLNGLRWNPSLEHALSRLNPGGVLVDAPLPAAAENVREFLSKVARSVAAVPFLALREEGGLMDPLRAFLPPLPSPRAAAVKGLAAVQRLGELVGAALQLLGFNTNFAPQLDLGSLAENATRSFSTDPQQVAECGGAFLTGLERSGVRACGKHFPGLGSAGASGATELPLVSKPMAELWREDLVPYRALLPRLPLILVSTAAYKAYDFNLLQSAGLSPKVVEGLLRAKLGYEAVAIAYALETKAVRGTLSLEEAAVQALAAGCDMLLVEDPPTAERVRAAVSTALQSGKLPSPRLEQALKRIELVKRGLKPPTGELSRGSLATLAKQFAAFSATFGSSDKV